MRKKVVIGLTGMPGSGKAIVRKIVKEMNYPVVVMGNVIREEAKRNNLKLTSENTGSIMLKLRKEEGSDIVAKRCIPKIREAKERVVIVDGVRSLHEVKEFKIRFPKFISIAIHASPKTRFRRLRQRKRSDDPRTWKTFIKRDLRELSVGIGDVIATADLMIINEGTKRQMHRKVRESLKGVMEE
jgi:dephospho-CoA kinase